MPLLALPFVTLLAASAAVADATRFTDDAMLDAARNAARGSETRPLDVTVNIGRTPAEQRTLEAHRDAEINALIAKLKRDATTRKPKTSVDDATVPAPWETEITIARPEPPEFGTRFGLGARPDRPDDNGEDASTRGRATILLVMHRTANTRRAPDPILCLEYGCYISSGSQAPAGLFNFNQALGPIGRIGRGAGACSSSEICIFRGVDLGSAGATMIQPVDMRSGRPDRRHLRDAVVDRTCRLAGRDLSCARPVRTDAYTMWVVPEHLASHIGPETLEAAAHRGLVTAAADDLPWQRR